MIISCGNCGLVPIYKWGLCEDCWMEYQELRQIIEENSEDQVHMDSIKQEINE